MERIRDRILEIAEAELPKYSLGLQVLGMDVCWGVWTAAAPDGTVIKAETIALLMAVRPSGPAGAVLLNSTEPSIPNACAFSSLWPTEREIREAVMTSCDALRETLKVIHARRNGNNP